MGGIRAQEEGITAHERGGIREGCPGDLQGVGDLDQTQKEAGRHDGESDRKGRMGIDRQRVQG